MTSDHKKGGDNKNNKNGNDNLELNDNNREQSIRSDRPNTTSVPESHTQTFSPYALGGRGGPPQDTSVQPKGRGRGGRGRGRPPKEPVMNKVNNPLSDFGFTQTKKTSNQPITQSTNNINKGKNQ